MHDPMTVAFEIKRPWPYVRRAPNGKRYCYWPAWFTIWHVDPETDGTDDSCGWFRPKLSEADGKFVEELIDWDSRFPYYFVRDATPGDAVALVFSLFQTFAWRLERRRLTPREVLRVYELAATESDNVQTLFRADADRYDRVSTLRLMLRHYRAMHRPWWRKPRWHVHHWRIQWHFGQTLRRFLLTRCAKCGGRFRWGESPMGGWSHRRTPWWQGEDNLWHTGCDSSHRPQ